jgi:hypothetical protein
MNDDEGTWKIEKAAHEGDLDSIISLHNSGATFTEEIMDCAAEYGHLHIVAWLHMNRREGCTTDAMDYAAKYGHLSVVRYLHQQRWEGCTTSAMDLAATYGHLNVVKFLHDNRSEECTTDHEVLVDYAAIHGHLHVMKYLYQRGHYGHYPAYIAATRGHLNVIIWLHEETGEHFNVVKWILCHSPQINDDDLVDYPGLRQYRRHLLNYATILVRAFSRYKLRKFIRTAARKYHLRCLIEYMPSRGIKYFELMEEVEKMY